MTLFSCLPALAGHGRSIAEFTPDEAANLGWRVVDDGVMGGLSQGRREIGEDGVLRFSGTLSLENNGGFSSLRTGIVEMDLSDADGLVLRVKGDGRTYQVRFSTDARFRGNEMSFQASIPTVANEWTEVKVPFDGFVGTWRGRDLPDIAFDPAKIRRLGLILADKQPGPFELRVDWIRTYGGGESTPDLVAAALADGRFGTLAKALKAADLVGALQGDGPFTVFAPTNEAFAKLPEGTLEDLLKPTNREALREILQFHVVPGAVGLADALKAGTATTLLGEPLDIRFSQGRVRVNDARLLDADVCCANGVIHVIDSVMLPPEPANDLAAVAKRAGSFGLLLAAVDAAGMADALAGESRLTLLAPTDEAFQALPEGTVETLLKPENRDQLRAVLALHAIDGRVSAGDALNVGKAEAIGGGTLRFAIDNGRFKVNNATILKTDIEADNGVIHVIDSVLLPEAKTPDGEQAKAEKPTPAERIEAAIARGVPVFNDGDPAGCAAIYLECLKALAAEPSFDQRLGHLVERFNAVEDDTRRAWLLRKTLDRIYVGLPEG